MYYVSEHRCTHVHTCTHTCMQASQSPPGTLSQALILHRTHDLSSFVSSSVAPFSSCSPRPVSCPFLPPTVANPWGLLRRGEVGTVDRSDGRD